MHDTDRQVHARNRNVLMVVACSQMVLDVLITDLLTYVCVSFCTFFLCQVLRVFEAPTNFIGNLSRISETHFGEVCLCVEHG